MSAIADVIPQMIDGTKFVESWEQVRSSWPRKLDDVEEEDLPQFKMPPKQ